MPSITYLGCPYAHDDPEVQDQRAKIVSAFATKLIRRGEIVFSPISMMSAIFNNSSKEDLEWLRSKGWNHWRKYDVTLLRYCQKIAVLMLPGWTESVGLTEEIRIANELDLIIEFYAEGDL